MKAAIITKYKQITPMVTEVPVPTIAPTDVLVKIVAASVNPIDLKTKDGDLRLLLQYTMPLIMGSDFAGVITAVGDQVPDFKVGDAVYGRAPKDRIGTFAEFIAIDHQAIALAIYQHGGYVTSVCHGIAGLLNIKDQTGQYLIAGKTITGFTATEELIAGKKRIVPFLNRERATAHGAIFSQHRFYREYAITDGQLITGQNPFSARAVARQLIAKL